MTYIRLKTVKYLLLLFILFPLFISAQEITLDVENVSLDRVLIELRNNYGIQTSFDHKIISSCSVSVKGIFSSAESIINELVDNCNFTYELLGDVYVIIEKPDQNKRTELEYYYYSGKLIDEFSTEPLPFSNIQTLDNNFVADASGNFSFRTRNSAEKISISHIGYYLLDTTLSHGTNQNIKLFPSLIGLDEIVVRSNGKISNSFIGEKAGLLQLNNKIATFLPGNNNNTLLNLLRLQPGILAAAEQHDSYIIRGSYRGQVLIQFDGIPLFSSTSLNNEIGIINPLMKLSKNQVSCSLIYKYELPGGN